MDTPEVKDINDRKAEYQKVLQDLSPEVLISTNITQTAEAIVKLIELELAGPASEHAATTGPGVICAQLSDIFDQTLQHVLEQLLQAAYLQAPPGPARAALRVLLFDPPPLPDAADAAYSKVMADLATRTEAVLNLLAEAGQQHETSQVLYMRRKARRNRPQDPSVN